MLAFVLLLDKPLTIDESRDQVIDSTNLNASWFARHSAVVRTGSDSEAAWALSGYRTQEIVVLIVSDPPLPFPSDDHLAWTDKLGNPRRASLVILR